MNGFGITAPLPAELALLGSVLVVLLLTVGVTLARRKRYTAHRWVQTVGVVLNLALVVAVMLGSFAKAAAPGIPQRLAEPYYAVAAMHGLLGLVAVVFGVFVLLRGHGLVPKALQFSNYKAFMRTAYGLYLLATLAGVGLYTVWYRSAPRADAQAIAASAPDTATVPMIDFGFTPRELVVPVGATVTWVNQDAARHNVVADDGTAFRSELLTRGERFTTTLGKTGDFAYYCELHGAAGGADMAGIIRVVPAGQAPVLAAQPAPAPTQPTPADELAGAALPTQARSAIVQLLEAGPGLPEQQGYAAGLHAQADEMLRHAAFAQHAQQAGDAAGLRRHAEHVYNLLAGALDPAFGDLNDDGRPQNPGDGFGMLPNGTQAGYIQATIDTAVAVAGAADATAAIKLHAGHVQISAENTRAWATEARDLALRLAKAPSANASDAARLVQLSQQIARGADANGDGEIAPVAGEGGALVAYEHARYMAGLDAQPAVK